MVYGRIRASGWSKKEFGESGNLWELEVCGVYRLGYLSARILFLCRNEGYEFCRAITVYSPIDAIDEWRSRFIHTLVSYALFLYPFLLLSNLIPHSRCNKTLLHSSVFREETGCR